MSDRMSLFVWISILGVSSYMITYFIDNKYPFSLADAGASLALCVVWVVAARETKRVMTEIPR